MNNLLRFISIFEEGTALYKQLEAEGVIAKIKAELPEFQHIWTVMESLVPLLKAPSISGIFTQLIGRLKDIASK